MNTFADIQPSAEQLIDEHYCLENFFTYQEQQEEVSRELTLLAAQINCANYRFIKLLGYFDAEKLWSDAGIKSCAHWLNWKCGIGHCAAREKVRVARCLHNQLPIINEYFSEGKISFSKVRAMTRVATPENEDFLIRIAEHGTASHIEKLVQKYEKVKPKDEDSQFYYQPEHENSISWHSFDDSMQIKVTLPIEEGKIIVNAVKHLAKVNKEGCIQKHDVSAVTAENDLQPSMEDFHISALVQLAERYLADPQIRTLPSNERCQVVLHTTIDDEHQRHGCDCHTDGQWLSKENAQRLGCDAAIQAVIKNQQGNVLNVGRKSRTVTPKLKRAIDIRDETCRFPGCCNNKYVDYHHIQHWAEGGETSTDNLIKLCRFHHRALHRGQFNIEAVKTPNNIQFVFKKPNGTVIQSSPKLPKVQPQDLYEHEYPEIDEHTAVTKWCGETMDYDMAVSALFDRDGYN